MVNSLLKKFSRHVVAITLIISLITPQVASAQLVTSDPIAAAWSAIKFISDKAFQVIGPVLQNAATVAVVNVGQQVAHDAAESIATWITSGAPGQNPLQYMKNPADYVKDAGGQALGQFLGNFSEQLGLGDFLCHPSGAAIAAPTGLLDVFGGPPEITLENAEITTIQPKCNVQDVLDSYTALGEQSAALLGSIQDMAQNGANEVDSVLSDQVKAFSQIQVKQVQTEKQIAASPSHAPVVSPISGDILRPGALVALEAEANTAKVQQDRENVQMSGLLASGAQAIPAIFASTLFNSLSKKVIERLTRGKGDVPTKAELGLNLANPFGGGRSVSQSGGPGAIFTGTKAAVISEGEWDQLTIFSSCPSEFAQADNCVMEQSFAAAVRNAQTGKPLTVKQALQNGTLHGDWELVPPSQVARNEDKNCYQSAYCYSNLVKLRKARIIPIGWEIAAATADGTGKTTLGLVAQKFNDCGFDTKGNPIRDDKHPYCHLIDPDWVLKMPASVCKAKVYGPVPESAQGATRKQECADQVTCLAEDETGQCTGAYGYCLRERNTWRFDADQCPAQYAGCRTFSNAQSGEINIIESTIDSSQCTAKNSGCTGYYTDYTSGGTFDTNSQKIYLNAQAAQCDAKYAGCTEVVNSNTAQTQYLMVPPASLGCKGEPSDPQECSRYARACTVDEVGCESYKPTEGGDAIPGIATFATRDATGNVIGGEWNDECSAECVGYASYYQQPTQAEPQADATLAFIPKSATQCTQEDAGCDAYVNIDSVQKGGGKTDYYSQIQHCRKPDDPGVNSAVFYTWEGSDQSGYQLHQHTLAIDPTTGAPLYDASTVDAAKLAASCSFDVYKKDRFIGDKPNPNFDPDCREILSSSGDATSKGKAYYMYLSKTLPVTAACTSYRKEKADQANCEASRGVFNNGACEYEAIPAQSLSCKAEAVGCRGYQGATAADAKNILTDVFSVIGDWKGGDLSNEGITVGDTVLKVTAAAGSHALTLGEAKTYNVQFWAKGQGAFDVNITSPNNGGTAFKLNKDPLKLTPEWRTFELNSVNIPAADDNATINFVPSTATPTTLYIDNVNVKEQGEVLFVIKDSWVTPNSCDPDPADGVPGPALNCREYQPQSDKKKPKVYLTGLTNLCRPQSAGCSKYQNTYNTAEITARDVPVTQDGKVTKTIPADDFVYLVATTANFCPADKKGCSAVGVTTYDDKGQKSISTTFRINNPEQYDQTLCKQEEEWCQTFKSSDGSQRYFKYPPQDHQCEYKDSQSVDGVTYSGWFKKGTSDPCYPDNVSSANVYGIYRNADTKYAGNVGLCPKDFNACTEFIDHADLSRDFPAGRTYYLMNNSKLDTTSCNGNASLKDGCVLLDDTSKPAALKYATLATYCKSDPSVSELCKDVMDAAKVSEDDRQKDGISVAPVTADAFTTPTAAGNYQCSTAYTNGLYAATSCDEKLKKLKDVLTKPTAVSLNTKMFVNASTGQISYLPQLYDATTWSCANTQPKTIGTTVYPADVDLIDMAVDAVRTTCSKFADANTLIKVRRDRTCSEWLSCKSSITVYDKQTQKYREVCSELGVCNALSTDSGAVGQCANWVVPQKGSKEEIARATPLTTDEYVRRNVGWYGQEYDGFSLWNKFQPDQLGWFSPVANAKTSDLILGAGLRSAITNSGLGTVNCANTNTDGQKCQAALVVDPKFKQDPDLTYTGTCYAGKCWYSPDGFKRKQATLDDYTKLSCRGYPEADSPFPTTIVAQTNEFGISKKRAPGFENDRVCDANAYIKLNRTADDWTNIGEFKDILGLPPTKVANESCECSYRKVTYGDIGDVHYYGLNQAGKVELFPVGTPIIPNNKCFAQGAIIPRHAATITATDSGIYTAQYTSGSCALATNDLATNLGTGDFWVPGQGVTKLPIGDTVGLGYSVPAKGGNGFWYPVKINSRDLKNDLYKVTFPDGQIFDLTHDQLAAPARIVGATAPEVPAKGICDGGWFVFGDKTVDVPNAVSKKGITCQTDFDCIDERVTKIKMKETVDDKMKATPFQYSQQDGHCQFQKENIAVIGWQGYCLEKDLRTHLNNDDQTRACLTWLPLDVGGVDIYNQFTSAAYQPANDGSGKYYCAESKGRKVADTSANQDFTILPHHEDSFFSKPQPGRLDYIIDAPKKSSTWGKILDIVSSGGLSLIMDLVFSGSTDAFYSAICGAKDCTSGKQTEGSEGYRNYGKAGVTATDLRASEIDYIELTATNPNDLFPEGYQMKIVNDGRVRVYVGAGNKSAAPDKACPVQKAGNHDTNLYDFFDPKIDLQGLSRNVTWKKQGDLLSRISQQVRCSNTPKVGGMPQGACDYYQDGKPDPNYFVCSTGEQTASVSDPGKHIAITGVAKYGGDSYSSGAVKQLIPQPGQKEPLGQIWFVRADSREITTTFSDDSDAGSGTHPNEEIGDAGLASDIINYNGGGVWDTISPGSPDSSYTSCDWGDGSTISDSISASATQLAYELRVKFDRDGKFVGIDAGTCQSRKYSTNHPIAWKVRIHLRDACTTVARVVAANGTDNVGWTNRLWTQVPSGAYTKFIDSYLKTDGSLPVAGGAISPDKLYGTLRSQIAPGALSLQAIDPWYGYAEEVKNTAALFTDAPSGKSYSCEGSGATGCVTGVGGAVSLSTGVGALNNLFAYIYDVYRTDLGGPYGPADVNYLPNKNLGDARDADFAIKAHPVVFALDPSACNGATQSCRMTQRNAFTVNGVWQTGETVYGKESVTAKIQFYGWADENHLPLRRVTVDWGDGTTNLTKDGEYRNHKSVCSAQDARPATVCVDSKGAILDINHTCNTSADCVGDNGAQLAGATCQKVDDKNLKWSFGSWAGNKAGDEGACEENFFQFGHAYTFTDDCGGAKGGQLFTADANVIAQYNLKGKVSVGERFCMFRPRVQLLDNWNVCNGVDAGGTVTGYGGYVQLQKLRCGSDGEKNAFTPYQGFVIVKE